jgi:hypothetical protein
MPQLIGDYSYKVMTRDELFPYIQDHQASIFAENQHLDTLYALSEAERNALNALGERLAERYRLGFGIFQGEVFVGWHLGQQTLAGTFEMARTGIVREHQNRGLYTALLPIILAQLKNDGFQVVFSRHNLTNNAVIIPKLKAGFVITGLELDDRFGTLVKLSYYFNPLRRKLLDVRVGQRRPDNETRDLL